VGKTVVMATHDLSVANKADRVVMLRDGAIEGELSGREITPARLKSW
jgi:ABC-type lipoprotein export system ATPase subunit